VYQKSNRRKLLSPLSHFVTVVEIDNMRKDFVIPPMSAKLWALWWWLEGNIDKEGIGSELLEMKRVGLAGALLFNAGSSSYRNVTRTYAGPQFMRDTWQLTIYLFTLNFDKLHKIMITFYNTG
jgi:hypothetical protein